MIPKIKNIIVVIFLAGFFSACDVQKSMYREDVTKKIFLCSDSELIDSVVSIDIYLINDERCGWSLENWLRENNKGHEIIIDKERIKQIISKLEYDKRPKADNIPFPRPDGEELHIILTTISGTKAYIRIYGFQNKHNIVWAVKLYTSSGYQLFPKGLQEIIP